VESREDPLETVIKLISLALTAGEVASRVTHLVLLNPVKEVKAQILSATVRTNSTLVEEKARHLIL
jgi:hypothetical protein